MSTSQEVVQRTPQQELVARVRSEEFKEQLSLALPENVTPERFVRATATALLDNPDIVKAEPDSVFQALLRSAQDGLMPDGREAALVLFGGKAVYMPMVGGFRKIAAEHGWTIRSAVVYDADEFEVELGDKPKVRHVPVRPGVERGEIIAAYAVGAHKDGRREVEVMTVSEIEKVRGVSRAKDRGPWVEWYSRMCEKSAARRLFAKLPLADIDRQQSILSADTAPADAALQMYGPNGGDAFVNRSTGEISSAPLPADVEGDRSAPDGQQAGAVATGGTELPLPSTASAPDPEAEPVLSEATEEPEPSAWFVVPETAGKDWRGKTLAEIAALGDPGEKYLAWIAKNPGRVGPELHAAVQRFRPGLFEATA